MKHLVTEFVIAFGIAWGVAALLSGCAVDESKVYDLITKTKAPVERHVAGE